MKTVADFVKQHHTFEYIRGSELWYKSNDGNFMFSVPVKELDGAELQRVEKGIVLMKWIKRQYKINEEENYRVLNEGYYYDMDCDHT